MLSESRTLGEVKKIRDIAEAARTYARAAHMGRATQNHAAEIKLLAEHRAGSAPEGAIILDPLAGSGTTLVAAQATGRHFLGFEIDQDNVAICKTRLHEQADSHVESLRRSFLQW